MKHFLYLLVACLLLVSYVRCDGEPDDGIGGDVKRELDINVGGSGISIDSRSRADVDNRVRVEIQVSGDSGSAKVLRARLRAYSRSSNAIAQIDFKVKFEQLVEYVEVDGVDGYSTNDTTGATISLGDETYTFAQQADIGTGLDAVKVATATSNHFKITCKMGGALFNDSGVWAFTNSAKVDIDITNFPYTLSGSRVALIVGLVSQRTQFKNIQHDDTQPHVDSDAVVVRSGGINGVKDAFFSWAKQVTVVPTATSDVVAGPLTTGSLDSDDDSSNDDKKTVVYSFLTAPQPTSIHWDPVFGVNTLSGVASVVPTMLALAAMLVCAAFM